MIATPTPAMPEMFPPKPKVSARPAVCVDALISAVIGVWIVAAICRVSCDAVAAPPEPTGANATGAITTIAGNGHSQAGPPNGPALEVAINQPFGVEVAPDDALMIASVGHHRIYRLNMTTAEVTTIVGTGQAGHSGDGGPAAAATVREPYEMRFDADGHMYFVDMVAAVVRRVEAGSGVITTIAGAGRAGFAGDGGPATAALLDKPHSLALDGRGGLYIADIGNHRIRRVDLASGVITTIAGNGQKQLPKPGPAANSAMIGPRALAVGAQGRILYVALREGHSLWALDLETGRLSHVAGTGKAGFADGPADKATFNGPKGIALTTDGRAILVMDTENHAVRRVDLSTAMVTTLSGGGPKARGFAGDGGPASSATVKMDRPHGIATDARGAIYIGDSNNHRVRMIAPPGGRPPAVTAAPQP